MNDKELAQYEIYLEQTGKNENAAMDLWLRWKALTDLFYLGNDILGWKNNTDKTGKYHRVDPQFHRWLASVIEKEEDTLILVPRKHAKTTWTALYCCQLVMQNPNIRIGIFSSSGKLVRDVMRMIVNIFRALRRTGLFDDIIPDPKDDDCSGWQKKTKNELTVYRPDSEAAALLKEPQITALSTSAHFTGAALDIGIIDDIIDKDTVRTAEQMQKSEEWWDYIQSILELHGSITKIIGTFYHYNDLYNKIIRERQIPKRNIFIKEIGGDGAPILYQSWLTQKDIDRLRRRMTPYIFSCQYKLNPIPKEEQILPPPQPMHETLPPDAMGYDWYMMVDPAATATTHSVNTGCVVSAVNSIKRIYFEQAKNFKKETGDLAEAIVMEAVNVYKEHGVFPLKIGIEFGLQEALKFAIETKRAEMEIQLKIKIILNIIPIPVSRKLSKASRVYFTLGQAARNRQVSVNKRCQNLVYEMDHFTGKGKEQDNLVDAAAMVFAVMDENMYRKFVEDSYNSRKYETFNSMGREEKEGYSWGSQFVA